MVESGRKIMNGDDTNDAISNVAAVLFYSEYKFTLPLI